MQFLEHNAGGSDQDFLEIVDRVLSCVLKESGVKELFLVAIDNGFDKKWLRYSGKNLIPTWYPTVSVPLFPPSRVVQQTHFIRVEDGGTAWKRTPILLYSMQERPFEMRRPYKIREISASTVFAWYSLNASKNRAASLMTYTLAGDEVAACQAGFRKKHNWNLHLTREISPSEMNLLFFASNK